MRKFLFITALTVLSVLPNVYGQQLGRLFTTSAERAKLDLLRKRGGVEPAVDQPKLEAQPPGSDQTTLDGYVTRSSGKTTTWINQTPHDENDTMKNVLVVQQPGRAPAIYIQTQSGKRVKVKVGETLDMKSGTVRKVYEPPMNVPPSTTETKP